LPGVYVKECWNKESVFIYYLHIGYIEPILAKYIHNYSQYSFMSVDKMTWQDIIKNLNLMKETLRQSDNYDEFTSNLGFSFDDVEENFTRNFEESRKDLMKMIDDFVLWLQETLKNHNKIAVMGM
jgi:hypothetical protein